MVIIEGEKVHSKVSKSKSFSNEESSMSSPSPPPPPLAVGKSFQNESVLDEGGVQKFISPNRNVSVDITVNASVIFSNPTTNPESNETFKISENSSFDRTSSSSERYPSSTNRSKTNHIEKNATFPVSEDIHENSVATEKITLKPLTPISGGDLQFQMDNMGCSIEKLHSSSSFPTSSSNNPIISPSIDESINEKPDLTNDNAAVTERLKINSIKEFDSNITEKEKGKKNISFSFLFLCLWITEILFNLSFLVISTKECNSFLQIVVNSATKLADLFRKCRFSRVRSRFVVPVLYCRGKNICRSATLSHEAEVLFNTWNEKTKNFWYGQSM